MEKIKLNNQIVSMRKYVKQAKVHVVNKLVKQVKILNNRKGNENRVKKAKRKAERLLEAVSLLKKIKPDDVSKLALSKAKDWKDVLLKKNSSLHDRCIAMLANYGAVQKEVETFYNENEDIGLKISNYIEQWEKKIKPSRAPSKVKKTLSDRTASKDVQKEESLSSNKKNKFKAVMEMKSKSNSKINDEEFKMFQKDETIYDNDEEDILSKTRKPNNHKNSIKNTAVKELKCSKNNSIKDEESDNSDVENQSDENNDETIADSLRNDNEKARYSKNPEMNVNKIQKSTSKSDLLKMYNNPKNKLKAITLLNLNELEGLDEIPVGSSSENNGSDGKEMSENEASQESIDPFFLSQNEDFTGNKNTDSFFLGDNKGDSNAKDLGDSFKDTDCVRIRDSAHSFKNETQTVRKNTFYRGDDQFRPQRNFQKSTYNHSDFPKRFRDDKNSQNCFKRNKFVPKNSDGKFPERNRKDFKLKSKSFSPRDSYDKNMFKNTTRNYGSKDDNIPMKSKQHTKGKITENLHPSWEAKRKQKELLSTSFQGKRMVFND